MAEPNQDPPAQAENTAGMSPFQQKIAKYRRYNAERKEKAAIFNPNQSTLLFALAPYLLHSNYPDLPGYVESSACPFGIHRFDPNEAISIDTFRRYFPDSTALRVDTPSPFSTRPVIHSLLTIGSIGTIAQSEISDCDYWVSIHREELGENGLALLQQKCRLIEEWLLKRGVEVHFFLMDITETRENSFASDAEDESAGSAIKALLKDELFRTHILVAGKMLLWWFIPPGLTEDAYRKLVNTATAQGKIKSDDFVDLGYLSDIPKSEIFGACLWQMNKALDSPFKSVIKFAYLELLLRRDSKTLPLFSDRVKCLITFPEKLPPEERENIAAEEVDPYLLLSKELIAFYQQDPDDQSRVPLIQECLFLKVLEGVESQKNTKFGQRNHLKATMAMMQNWNLLPADHSRYLNFRFWTFKELLALGSRVHEYLIETYKRLRWIFKSFDKDTTLTITERDISILGRKLFTFYEHKDHKIEYVRSVSRDLMAQGDITIHITRYENTFHYYAFQGAHDLESIKAGMDSVIKREDDPVRLIVWLLVNGILSRKTCLHLTKNFLPIDLVDLQQLTEVLIKIFPIVHFSKISAADLLKRETVARALVVVNFNKEPVKGSKTLKSVIVTVNNYGEYFLKHCSTLIQLKNTIRSLLTQHYVSRWNKNLEIFIPTQDEQGYIKSLIEG